MLNEYHEEQHVYNTSYKLDLCQNHKERTHITQKFIMSSACNTKITLASSTLSICMCRCISFQLMYFGTLKLKLLLKRQNFDASWPSHCVKYEHFRSRKSFFCFTTMPINPTTVILNNRWESLLLKVKHKALKSEKHQAQCDLLSLKYYAPAYWIRGPSSQTEICKIPFLNRDIDFAFCSRIQNILVSLCFNILLFKLDCFYGTSRHCVL